MLKYERNIQHTTISAVVDLPRETMHRMASTTCVNGVKLLMKRMTGGIPSAGQITPERTMMMMRREERRRKATDLSSVGWETHCQEPLPSLRLLARTLPR
jgi:hypothetical protein